MKTSLFLIFLFISFNSFNQIQTVTIGGQMWMTKNLNVDKFRNGDPIPQARTDEEWKSAGENGEPAWCYYENDETKGKKYGKLYNWYAVNDPRGLAPEGYHIPEVRELDRLCSNSEGKKVFYKNLKSTIGWSSFTVGGESEEECSNCASWSKEYRNKVPCHKCKDTRVVIVKRPIETKSGNGSNSSGFNGLPGGLRNSEGEFQLEGEHACWWSSTPSSTQMYLIWVLDLINKDEDQGLERAVKNAGLYVRCIKD